MDYLLEKGEVLTLVTTPGMKALAVVSGRVWLTKYDDPSDYCIGSGTALAISTSGRVVIEALESAAVSVLWKEAATAVRVSVVNVDCCRCAA